ncbi:MAG: DUF6428 family protein [Bacteroidota bacterium]
MTLLTFKQYLSSLSQIAFQLPDGTLVPRHFHVTEVGKIQKEFIDCGGQLRSETSINLQLWEANDYDHRLHPEKLVQIIELATQQLHLPDAIIEVEYQGATIQKFGLDFDGQHFLLTTKQTACLANCIPEQMTNFDLPQAGNCC